MSNLVRVGITHGDYNGIGYEVILKALNDPQITEIFTPVIFGNRSLAETAIEKFGLNDLKINYVKKASETKDGQINLVEIDSEKITPEPGKITNAAGASAVIALEQGVASLKEEDIDVLVTAPISKEGVRSESFQFPGHTEFLESRLGEPGDSMMILCNDELRVALLTIHLPLSQVAANVTKENLISAIEKFSNSLKRDFGKERPAIAVLSLNPHAGDGGILGEEEENIIKPALEELQQNGLLAFGPYPSDGFFGHGSYRKFDGVLAMYHDQGLAPFKTIADAGVNFTAGLPYVRTSPDHGTAFDIAWKGIADEKSMRDAIYTAIDIFRRRGIYDDMNYSPLKKHVVEKPDKGERQDKPLKKLNFTEETDD